MGAIFQDETPRSEWLMMLTGEEEDKDHLEVAFEEGDKDVEWLLVDSGSPVTACPSWYAPEVPGHESKNRYNLRDATGGAVTHDGAKEVGFEMLHTHVSPTNLEPSYLAQVKAAHDYIHQK